jgi:hypothetical protein
MASNQDYLVIYNVSEFSRSIDRLLLYGSQARSESAILYVPKIIAKSSPEEIYNYAVDNYT